MSTISQRSHLTDSEAWRVVGRLEGGKIQVEVAQAIGVSQSVISRIWNRFLETGSAGRRPGQDRKRATTSNEDPCLVLTARRHRNKNAIHLQRHLRSATGTTISTQTVRDWTHGVGLYARRSMRGSRNTPGFVHESVRFDSGGVLVYGGIPIDGRTDLYIIRDGPLTARRYRDEILRPIVVPYAAAIGDDFILMDNNCRPPDRANLVEDFLFEEGIVRMEWPACSPDMNPIQHVWDALGRRVAGRQPYPQTLQELEKALLEEWDRIPQLVINRLIDSMSQRYITTENLLAFKKAKADARRVRRQSQRQSWIRYVSSLTSLTSSKQLWKKVKAANGIYREFSFPILQTSDSVFSSPDEIANILGETFQSVSSTASYNSRFLEIKRQAERSPIIFSTSSFFPYNCDFTMTELQKALLQAHNTSPGPDGITYTMLRHLNPNSLANILFLFNRVWKEHCFPSNWREAIVIPILKPGKVTTDPLSYRPIALTSCFCKTFERRVNSRLVYVLEKEKCISPLQSGFRKGRSTLDNLVFLESQIRNAFVREKPFGVSFP
ncbi:transposable element Tcb2 transposase [Trichonephila clavipes]|nr:transposable element Tcb2 transposase [Trichonephila clavipes]